MDKQAILDKPQNKLRWYTKDKSPDKGKSLEERLTDFQWRSWQSILRGSNNGQSK